MKFEHIIWIVAFLIYVVVAIIKKGRAASKTGTQEVAKKTPEWREKLNTFLAQIQQQATGEEDTFEDRSSGWEDLAPVREEVSFDTMEQVIEKPPLPKMKPPVPKRKPPVVKADAKRLKPAVPLKKYRPKDLAFGIQELRKAVIWSEILAPPLALRDK